MSENTPCAGGKSAAVGGFSPAQYVLKGFSDTLKGNPFAALVACAYLGAGLAWAGEPAAVVDVVEATTASASLKLAMATLQGRVNGDSGGGGARKVYLLSAPWRQFWLERAVEKGYVRQARRLSVDEFFAAHRGAYDAVLVVDPSVPASVNVATMMASLQRAVVCEPQDVARVAGGKRVEDLRGRWRSNVAAYEWAFAELWPRISRAAIQDHATFADPDQLAIGMAHVFVNGTHVLKDGEHTGAKPERVVRGPGCSA